MKKSVLTEVVETTCRYRGYPDPYVGKAVDFCKREHLGLSVNGSELVDALVKRLKLFEEENKDSEELTRGLYWATVSRHVEKLFSK